MEPLDCVCAADIPGGRMIIEGFRGADDEDEEPPVDTVSGYW